MIEIKVGKKDIQMPEKLSILQYQRLKDRENIKKDPIQFIVSMTGLNDEDVKYANKNDVDFVYRFLTQHYLMKQSRELKTSFELDGIKYGLMSQITTLNFGGWVDLEFLTADGVEKNMDKIMSLFYRPIVKEKDEGFELEIYDHDSMLERAEIFKDLPVEYFWGLSDFFMSLVKAFTENTKASLEYQRTKEKALTRLRMINPLNHLYKLRVGSGGRALWSYVKRTLQRWMK